MHTTIFICPFAQFGNPGTQAGAELLGDALRELLDDNLHEKRPSRPDVYKDAVTLRELPLSTPGDYHQWHDQARKAAKQALDAGEFLIWVGGNHLSVLPLYEELGRQSGSLVVQLDAHLDVYHFRDNVSELSHGNYLRFIDSPPAVINVGHRDLFLPSDEIARHFAAALSVVEFVRDEAKSLSDIKGHCKSAKRVLLDIDADVFDPAFVPAVVDALPFGMTPQQALKLVDAVWSKKLAGFSLSEFDPGRDQGDRSLQLLIWLIEYVLLRRYGG